MSLKIVGSLTSPFSRIVRMMCEELHLDYELDVTPPFTKMNAASAEKVNAHNPLMKVPVLIDGETEILDSRVIVAYLLKKHGKDTDIKLPQSVEEENLLSVIYGIVDAGVLWFMLQLANPEVKKDAGFMPRSQERIERGLIWLDRNKNLGKEFGVPEALLICVVEWFTKRDIHDWQKFRNVYTTWQKYKDRPSLVKTRIPENV
jgi:glutathione S-transferase